MKNVSSVLIALLVALVAGCKIDDPGTGLKGNVYNTYQPTSKGSSWTYNKTSAVAGEETETQTMTGGVTLINKRVYYTVRTQTPLGEDTLTRYSQEDKSYYLLSQSKVGDFTIEYLYLKEDYIVGRVWTAPVTPDGLLDGTPARIQGAVLERNITINEGGKKFSNVIHTRLHFQYDQGAGFSTIEIIDYYVAKGVGIIRVEYSDGQTVNSNKIISDYDIK